MRADTLATPLLASEEDNFLSIFEDVGKSSCY
jgi:hypothetical protein